MASDSVITLQMYTVRAFCKTLEEIAASCKKLKAIGFDAVQAACPRGIALRDLGPIFKGEGLRCASDHVDWERLQSETGKVAEEHHVLGCDSITVPSCPPPYHSAEGYARFAKAMSAVGRTLKKEGIVLSYHNHAFEFEKYPANGGQLGLDILMQESDPEVVNFEIDTYWVQHGGGTPANWIRKAKGRMVQMHVKDMTVRAGKPLFAEVGEGNLDWPAILAAGKEAGVKWYVIEQDVCERDPFESLGISLRNLRSWGLR